MVKKHHIYLNALALSLIMAFCLVLTKGQNCIIYKADGGICNPNYFSTIQDSLQSSCPACRSAVVGTCVSFTWNGFPYCSGPCDANCRTTPGSCNLTSAKCLNCVDRFSPDSYGFCLPEACTENCLNTHDHGACDFKTGECIKCADGFLPSINGHCQPSTISQGTLAPVNGITVTTIDQDCVLYNKDEHPCIGQGMYNPIFQTSCSMCQSGTDGSQAGCISFTWKGQKSCLGSCDLNCATSAGSCNNSTGMCLVCRTGFYPHINGTCQSVGIQKTMNLSTIPSSKPVATINPFRKPSEIKPTTMTIASAKPGSTTKPSKKPTAMKPSAKPNAKPVPTTKPSRKPGGALFVCDLNCSPIPGSCEQSTRRCFLCITGYFPSESGNCQADPRDGLTSFQLALSNICPVVYWRMEHTVTPAYSTILYSVAYSLTKYTVSGYSQLLQALDFTNSQYVVIPYLATINPLSFTVMFWAQIKGNEIQTVISSLNADTHGSYGYVIYCSRNHTWAVDMSQHQMLPALITFDSYVRCDAASYSFIVLTFSNKSSAINMYVNGKIVLNVTSRNFVPNNGNIFVIGGRKNNTQESMCWILDGALDEVAIFSSVLSSNMISLLYSLGIVKGSYSMLQNVAFTISFCGEFSSSSPSFIMQHFVVAGLSSVFQVQADQISLQVTTVRRRMTSRSLQKFHIQLTGLTLSQVRAVQITVLASSDGTSNTLLVLLCSVGLNVTSSSMQISQLIIFNTPHPTNAQRDTSKLVQWVVIGVLCATFCGACCTGFNLVVLRKHSERRRQRRCISASNSAQDENRFAMEADEKNDQCNASESANYFSSWYDPPKQNIKYILTGSEQRHRCSLSSL